MYEAFFNLKTKPFSLLPDPDFLFLSSRHAVALSLLDYSLSGQAGFCVITGEIGSGKTTLVRAFLSRVGREFTVGLISNTHSALRDMAAWALGAFGQKPTGGSPAETYQELIAFLIAEYGAGRQCILIVDESQNLTIEALEELRLLSNINSGKDLLLQIVLVGQPELLDKLRRPELNQFAQRIAVSHHLTALPYAETKRYIEHRLKVSGAEQPIFTEMAMGAVQYFSGGVPRLINSICDMALVYAFADAVTTITEDLVFRVVADRQGSGIAPYARTDSADDPAVRAEIINLARSGAAMTTSGRATAEAKTEQARGRNTKTAPAERAGKAKLATAAPAGAVPAEAAAVPAEKPEEQPVPAPVAVAKPIETATPLETATPTEAAAPATPEAAAAAPAPEAKPTEVKPAPVLASEAVAADPKLHDRQDDDVPGPNPYFFRESTEEEELLLTTEVVGQPASGAEPTAVRPLQAPEPDKTPERDTQSLKIASDSDQTVAKDLAPPAPAALAPSPEPSSASVERIPVAANMRHEPETANAHLQLGTATPTRRSWWRRRLARGN